MAKNTSIHADTTSAPVIEVVTGRRWLGIIPVAVVQIALVLD